LVHAACRPRKPQGRLHHQSVLRRSQGQRPMEPFRREQRVLRFVRFLMTAIRQLFFVFLLLISSSPLVAQTNLRKTALKSATPDDEIVRLDINGDGKPDILERWWNGKRVRWLDENGDMSPTDLRGDQVADVMQIDKNGDGIYDSALDINIKWADNDGDGRADLQAFVTQGREWANGKWDPGESHWMVYIDVEK